MATTPNITPSPKERFAESAERMRHHRELTQRSDLQIAFDYTMLQLQGELISRADNDLNKMAGVALKMAGAAEFIRVFKNLAEQEVPLSVLRPVDNLTSNR